MGVVCNGIVCGRINRLDMVQHMKKGFTLIELLVVIAICGILMAIVLTTLNGLRQDTPTEIEGGRW